MDGSSNGGPAGGATADSIVLEEEIDPNYVPSEAEVLEYAKWLGMDLKNDHDLFWVAKEGLMAPLPKNWKPCKTKDTEDIYYFNFSTGDSTWDHPCDGYYKRLYEEEKKKKEVLMKESSDQVRTRAKQDVDQLLGKGEKKKKKKTGDTIDTISTQSAAMKMGGAVLGPLTSLEKKPLPGIQALTSMSERSSLSATRSTAVTLESRTEKITSSTIVSSSGSKIASLSITPTSSAEFDKLDAKPQIAKKTSRLISVLAESDDNKLKDAPSESKSEPTGRYSASEAVSTNTAEAKKQNEGAVTKFPANADLTGDDRDSELVSKLRSQIRNLENDNDIKTRKCNRLEAENAELERRVLKEKKTLHEIQENSEEAERKYQKQIRLLKDEVSQLDKQVEDAIALERQLRATNRDLQLNLEIKEANSVKLSSTVDRDVASSDFGDEISKLESSKRHMASVNDELKGQLTSQEALYKSKLDMKQRKFDDLLHEHELLTKKFQQRSDDHAKELSDMRRNIESIESKSNTGSSTSHTDTTNVPSAQFIQVSSELSTARIERDDFINKCKRLEQSIASWESDCKDKEARLQLARNRANDLENEIVPLRTACRQSAIELADANDNIRLLDMEKVSMKAEQAELRSSIAEMQNRLKLNEEQHATDLKNQKNNMQAIVDSEITANAQSEKKMRGFQEELLQLQRRLQDVKDGQVPVDTSAEAFIAQKNQLTDIKIQLATSENKVQTLAVEIEGFQPKISSLLERNTLLQTEADRLREALHIQKSSIISSASNIDGDQHERITNLEMQLLTERNKLEHSREMTASLKLQMDDAARTWKNNLDQLSGEKATLQAEIKQRDIAMRDLDSRNSKLQIDLLRAEKAVELKDVELLQVRKDDDLERKLRMRLEKELSDLKASNMEVVESASAPKRTHASVAFQSDSSIVELSIIVGKQQAQVAQLEAQLRAAESTIVEMNTKQHQQPLVEQPQPASQTEHPVQKTQLVHQDKGNDIYDGLDKSLLREMMLEFARVRKPFVDANKAGCTNSHELPNMNWNAKILKEKKFIQDARNRLNDEKVAIRLEQSGLIKRREAWKKSRNDGLMGGIVKTKDVVRMLNKQTLQLNLAIEQAQRTQKWLDNREQKLERLEGLLLESTFSIEESIYERGEAEVLGRQLDLDATTIELEPFLPLQASSNIDTYNQENVVPQQLFFPDNVIKETNTYMQSKADERAKTHVRNTGATSVLSTRTVPVPEAQIVGTNEDRRVLQLRIQREVDERNKCMIAYQEHAG